MSYSNHSGRLKKFPLIDGSYESVDYQNLFYAGKSILNKWYYL